MDVFAPRGRRIQPTFQEIGSQRTPVLIMDDFYRSPERVREFFLSSPAPIWKTNGTSRNFLDYYDCRQSVAVKYGLDPLFMSLEFIVKEAFSVDVRFNRVVSSNLFQLIADQPPGTNAHPHHDVTLGHANEEMTAAFNVLVFLNTDEECRGGTAFYRHVETGLECLPGEWLAARDFEREYLSGGQSEADNYWLAHRGMWEPIGQATMKFNRLVVFPGHLFHGAWHEPGWFKDYPRITQVFFSK